MNRRVVISGIGIIAPTGTSTPAFWKACLSGTGTIASIPAAWHNFNSYASQIWAPLPTIDPAIGYVNRIEQMQLDMSSIIALCATRQALENAEIRSVLSDEKKNSFSLQSIDSERCGVFIGSGIGGITSFSANHNVHRLIPLREQLSKLKSTIEESTEKKATVETMIERMKTQPRFNPFAVAMTMPNASAAAIGIKYGIHGPNLTICNACASGTCAIGHAFEAIRLGTIESAFAGGVEFLNDGDGGIFRGFDIAKTLVNVEDNPETANRPFDKKRSGFLFAEGGGAVLFLESYDHAMKRGAPIIAEILGFAESFDAFSMMALDDSATQISRMIRSALQNASCDTAEIDYINAHGTGTQLNDEIETAAIDKLFPHKPLVNSTKSLIGHTIGAAGAIEAAVTALSLANQTTHICKNLEEPIRDLNFVREVKSHKLTKALSHSFAFGGHNAGLVLGRIA